MNEEMFAHRTIIDTDIGTGAVLGGDPDDAIALALAMNSPEIKLEGVTTVYRDAIPRARFAQKILHLGGRDDIDVYPGLSETMLRNRPGGHTIDGLPWEAGREDEGVDIGREWKGHAVDFMIKTIMDNPGEITLVALGPLTNVAVAMVREPRIIKYVKEIILMGGAHRLGGNGAGLNPAEANVKRDPEAASVVFSSQAPIVMVGLDVTMKVRFTQNECDLLRKSGNPLNEMLANMVEQWFEVIRTKRPDIRQTGQDKTHMQDPLAVSLLLNRSLVTTRKMKVTVEYDHRVGTGQTVAIAPEESIWLELGNTRGNVEACIDVDSEAFRELLLERLNCTHCRI